MKRRERQRLEKHLARAFRNATSLADWARYHDMRWQAYNILGWRRRPLVSIKRIAAVAYPMGSLPRTVAEIITKGVRT